MKKNKNYYVYQITNKINNKKYIGYRGTTLNPEDDLGVKYFSTSHDKDFKQDQKINRKNYLYEVLSVYCTADEAIHEEMRLHELYDVAKNPKFYNKSKQTLKGYDCSGFITVKDKSGNTFKVTVDDPRYTSGEYKAIMYGMVTVKDKSGNMFAVSKNDPKYINGDLIPCAKNTVTVKGKDGRGIVVSINDPKYINGEYETFHKGMITVKDKDGNTSYVSVTDERYLNGELVAQSKGKVVGRFKDGSGSIQVDKDDPRFKTGELLYPTSGLVSVKDKEGNKFLVSKDDPKYINGEVIPVNAHPVTWHKKELHKLWKDNEMLCGITFRKIAIRHGYDDTSYGTIVNEFINNLTDEDKLLREQYKKKHNIIPNRSKNKKEKIKKIVRIKEHWNYYDELYVIWIINGNPSYRRFRTIVTNNGYPNVCYNGMYDAFLKEFNKEYKKNV